MHDSFFWGVVPGAGKGIVRTLFAVNDSVGVGVALHEGVLFVVAVFPGDAPVVCTTLVLMLAFLFLFFWYFAIETIDGRGGAIAILAGGDS